MAVYLFVTESIHELSAAVRHITCSPISRMSLHESNIAAVNQFNQTFFQTNTQSFGSWIKKKKTVLHI